MKFEPVYKGPIEGYVRNFVGRNFWRVCRHREYEDLVQDSHVIFLKLKEEYKDTVDNPQWFMSLFMRSFSNHVTNISILDTRNSVEITESCIFSSTDEDSGISEDAFYNLTGETENAGYLKVLLMQAPSEVRTVLSVLLNCPAETLELVQNALTRGKDVAGNIALCKMVGQDPKYVDLVEKVRQYLLVR